MKQGDEGDEVEIIEHSERWTKDAEAFMAHSGLSPDMPDEVLPPELVAQGNTVVVIEHNLEVIKTADWVIDLGPEGGDGGGEIVAWGPPEDIVKAPRSYTGKFLAPVLKKGRAGKIRDTDEAAE